MEGGQGPHTEAGQADAVVLSGFRLSMEHGAVVA